MRASISPRSRSRTTSTTRGEWIRYSTVNIGQDWLRSYGTGDVSYSYQTYVHEIGHALDAVLDSGDCGTEPTTVIDLTGDEVDIIRRGSGDPELFEG